MKDFVLKYFSRKFILTLLVVFLGSVLPVIYKQQGLSESITFAVLGLLTGVGVAYGFINVKDAQLDK